MTLRPDRLPAPVRLRSRLANVRVRSALAAAAVVAAAVGLTGVGLLLVAQQILRGNVDTAATERAQQVAALMAAGTPPAGLIASGAADQMVLQILDPTGQVLTQSPELSGRGPITTLRPASGE